MTNIIDLTQQLVAIPSFVDGDCNEIKICEFIFDFLTKNTNLKIIKQPVIDGRFNILAFNDPDIKKLIIGHTDTVGGYINPTISDGKLFGRGTTDMKSGIAAMMFLATRPKLPNNIGFLFYIDEEYDFIGMNKFIDEYKTKLKPDSIISLDGSELEIGNGCRGLIEISASVIGKSCHAATPQNGINAIDVTTAAISQLKDRLQISLNLAKIKSGDNSSNVVPDYCSFTIDIRPNLPEINAQKIIDLLAKDINSLGGQLSDCQIKFDYGSWLTPKSDLECLDLPFKDINNSGYIDIQMLWACFDQPRCLTFGAGTQSKAHTADEYVELDKLEKLEPMLFEIVNKI